MTNQIITTRKQQIDFPTVAIIRKGAEKQPNRPGKDLDSKFRVVFEPGMEVYEKRFKEIYDTLQPKVINAMLPFADIQDCYEISNEAYQAGMLVFKAVNGRVIIERDPTNSEYIVRGGEAQRPDAELEYDPFERTSIDYVGHDGSTKSLPIKTQTRLKLFIPEMRDFVWFLLKTTSYYDSLNIQNNMQAIQAVARSATGGNVAGVRINVFRAQQDILWNSNKGPRRIKKWLVQAKIDPEWVEKMIVRMSANTLNAGVEVQQLEAPDSAPDPEQDQDTSDDQIIDGTIKDIPEGEIEGEPTQKEYDFKSRPYDAETLKEALRRKADKIGERTASKDQRNYLASLINNRFMGDITKRYTVSRWLFGEASTKKIDGAMVQAAMDWLSPTPDSGGAPIIDKNAGKELGYALTAALKAEGQEELL